MRWECEMSVYYVPFTLDDQISLIQDLKNLGLDPKDFERIKLMERQLTEYGFLTDEETNSLQRILDQHGWMLE